MRSFCRVFGTEQAFSECAISLMKYCDFLASLFLMQFSISREIKGFGFPSFFPSSFPPSLLSSIPLSLSSHMFFSSVAERFFCEKPFIHQTCHYPNLIFLSGEKSSSQSRPRTSQPQPICPLIAYAWSSPGKISLDKLYFILYKNKVFLWH